MVLGIQTVSPNIASNRVFRQFWAPGLCLRGAPGAKVANLDKQKIIALVILLVMPETYKTGLKWF